MHSVGHRFLKRCYEIAEKNLEELKIARAQAVLKADNQEIGEILDGYDPKIEASAKASSQAREAYYKNCEQHNICRRCDLIQSECQCEPVICSG